VRSDDANEPEYADTPAFVLEDEELAEAAEDVLNWSGTTYVPLARDCETYAREVMELYFLFLAACREHKIAEEDCPEWTRDRNLPRQNRQFLFLVGQWELP
jgi:hypothetical protein